MLEKISAERRTRIHCLENDGTRGKSKGDADCGIVLLKRPTSFRGLGSEIAGGGLGAHIIMHGQVQLGFEMMWLKMAFCSLDLAI